MTSQVNPSRPLSELSIKEVADQFHNQGLNSREDLAVYCAVVLGYVIPWPSICPDHTSPLDALWEAFSDQTEFGIWHAMRGSGKTLQLAILGYLESVFKKRCGTTILGGSLEQSKRAIQHSSLLWRSEGAPRHLLIGDVAGTGYRLKNGSWVQALAASQKSVRGPHPQRLRLDEVDEMDPEIFDAALGQPMEAHGIPAQVVASSTLHHPFGMMATLVDKREERGAKLYQWCVEEVREPRGFWTNKAIEQKRKQVTEAMWEAEYILKRPTIGETIYDWETLERAYARGRGLVMQPRTTTEAGIDWGHTMTVMHIIQDTKERYQAPETHRWEYVELTERCEQISHLCLQHGISVLYTDSSPKDSNVTLGRILRKNRVRTRVQAVSFNKYKSLGIQTMRYLLEKDLLDIADLTAKIKLQQYHYKDPEQETVAKEDDHDPDAFTAWAASKSWLLGGR